MGRYDYSEHLKTIAWFGETDSQNRGEEFTRQDEREAYAEGRLRRYRNDTAIASQAEIANVE